MTEEGHEERRRNAVLLITDDNLLPPALHLWARLRALNNREDTDILLVLPDAAAGAIPVSEATLVIPTSAISIPDLKYSGPSHVTGASYLRIVAPRHLQQRYARVLYLDIDVLVADDSLFRVFDAHLTAPLAATRWHKISFDPTKVVDGKVWEGEFEFERYFNSGVLLIDVDRYVAADVDSKALEFLANKDGKTSTADQTALNFAVGNKWQELSPALNFRAELLPTFFAQKFPPVIIHYVGEEKSWQIPSKDHSLRSEQLTWLATQGHWRFLLKNVKFMRVLRKLRQRLSGEKIYRFPHIHLQNPLVTDYLDIPFVDHWNVQAKS